MSEVLDNLDIDLSAVDLSRPLIDNQVVLVRTGEVKIEKNDSGLRRLVVPLTLEEPATSTQGKPVNVGFQVTHGFLIDPTGKLTQERINEELAKFQVAVLKLDRPRQFGDLAQYRGQLVKVKFAVRQEKKRGDEQPNEQEEPRLFQDVKAFIKAS